MIDLNCDMGEGMNNEAELMPFITSANIACGAHAGDENTMREVAALCLQQGVRIGAHPSYPDRENFGRSPMALSPDAVYTLVQQQIRKLQQVATELGTTLHHVKPHGALYNRSAQDPETAGAIARAVADMGENLVLVGLSGSHSIAAAKALGLRTASEVFADRNYLPDGRLTPRTDATALIHDPQAAAARALQMVQTGRVIAANGQAISLLVETICIHGDGPSALPMAKAIAQALNGYIPGKQAPHS